MTLTGGCYCGALRYEAEGAPMLKAQCHCRACQTYSGGAPNLFMVMPAAGFRYVKGTPMSFRLEDRPDRVTRDFCATCGTGVASHRPGLPAVILKIGTLDDPAVFKGPKAAVFAAEKQAFHIIPEGVHAFDGLPPA